MGDVALTRIFSPAAKGLVEVEARGAIPQLYIRQPLRDDVQQRSIEADGRSDNGDDDPALGSIVRLPQPVPPAGVAVLSQTSCSSPPRFAPGLFPRRVLHPVFRNVSNGRRITLGRPLSRPVPIVVKSCTVEWLASVPPSSQPGSAPAAAAAAVAAGQHTSYLLISAISSAMR